MKKPIGLQLYSVRELAKNNLLNLLEEVADLGYQGVEFAGFFNFDIREISKVIHNLGLSPLGCHVPWPTKNTISQIADEAHAIGYKRVLVGLAPEEMQDMDGINICIEKFHRLVELAKSQKLDIVLHNHWWEFDISIEDKTPYEHFMHAVPDLLSELDIYWTKMAGTDPVKILNEWSCRIPFIHVKDGDFNDRMVHLPVGQGKMNMPEILSSINPSKVEWLIVELDNCDSNIIEATKESYNWLIDNQFGIKN